MSFWRRRIPDAILLAVCLFLSLPCPAPAISIADQYSVTALTDESGTVVERYAYDAYGNRTVLDAAGLPAASPLPLTAVGFTGRYHDAETGLIFYRARYYDPTLGRFISRDPIAEWGGINLYGYCANNPVGWLDPWGWDPDKVKEALESTPTGKKLIDATKVTIVEDSSKGAYYSSSENTMHLQKNASDADRTRSAAHELGHAYKKATDPNPPNIKKDSKKDYIDKQISGEVQADMTRHTIYTELQDKTKMTQPSGQKSWEQAKDKTAEVTQKFVGPKPTYKTSTTGQTYEQYYGDLWEKTQPKPLAPQPPAKKPPQASKQSTVKQPDNSIWGQTGTGC